MGRTLQDEINDRILRGDAYPIAMGPDAFKHVVFPPGFAGKGKKSIATRSENTNIAGDVGRCEDGWIGMALFVMCPSDRDAAFIGSLIQVMEMHGFATAKTLRERLREAVRDRTPTIEIADVWPKEAGPLRRR